MDADELLWRQYNQAVELYKYYLDIVIKLNVFFYAVTGAILSYVLANLKDPTNKLAVLLPLAMSLGLAALSLYGATLVPALRSEIFACRDALKLKTAPEVHVLTAILVIFGVIFLAVAGGCLYILCKY